ncbi:endoribonuclease [Lithospermum erythrorhizon]|uniref:Endoribonuclease n=1 Tax=Lithospermum erythrorhizon TaxID=34254 RepID=A0AAV3RI27_LITER
MELKCSVVIKLLVLQCFLVSCLSAKDFDFFYYVQQWPASYCDTRRSCCYPKTGKPDDDFSIHGLWPNNNDGTWPSNCDRKNTFDESEIDDLVSRMEKDWPSFSCPSSDGIKFWTHEWEKHGTCAESILDMRSYFETALDLKKKANLLQALKNAGIHPKNGEFHSLESIKEAIKEGVGHTPYIECNTDSSRNQQLYQVYLCVDTSASKFIDCPVFPHGKCGSKIQFPSLSGDQQEEEYNHNEL